jgi:hypothetical protein
VGELETRREQSAKRLCDIKSSLASAETIADRKACVYATGSFGRGEASSHSDLDLFMVGKRSGAPAPDGKEPSILKRLDEILIKAELIEATRKHAVPEFSGDGKYLVHYSVHDFTKTLGTPEDDVTNTFTARLLLLLESCPLVGEAVYWEAIEEVVAAYWRDYEDHKSNFMPAFLANDILRLWRTFCVNYEARTERSPDPQKAKGKIKNYKLKHSRMLTCYSALLFLLAIYQKKQTVSPHDALDMIKLTPTQRLEFLKTQPECKKAKKSVTQLLTQYERFLAASNAPEDKLITEFMKPNVASARMTAAYEFGDAMFEALEAIGQKSRFYRLLIV